MEKIWTAARSQPMPMELIAGPTTVIDASLRAGTFGAAQIISLESASSEPLQMRRTISLIKNADPEAHRFVFCVKGKMRYQKGDRVAVIQPGSVIIHDTSQEFCWDRYERSPSPCQLFMVTINRNLIAVPPHLLCAPINGQRRLPRAIARLLQVIAEQDEYFERVASEISDFLLTALDVLVATQQGIKCPIRLPREADLFRIRSAIFQRLEAGESVKPDDLAEAVNIKKRTLYTIAAEHGVPIGKLARRQLLEFIYNDLKDPTNVGVSSIEIAGRWGMGSSSQLSHAIKKRYDAIPSAIREQARRSTSP